MSTFKVGNKTIPYRFSSNAKKRCFYFHALDGADKTSDGTLYFDIAMEKDIVHTLWWFDSQREYSDIRASYKISDGRIQLRVNEDDLRYMISSVALDKSSIMNPKKSFHIEMNMPFLLHGLVFGRGEHFINCYVAFVRMFKIKNWSSSFNKYNVQRLLNNVFYSQNLHRLFQQMLTFLGRCLQTGKLKQDDFVFTEKSLFVKAIQTFCYLLNMQISQSSGNSRHTVDMIGSCMYNGIYRHANIRLSKLQEPFSCTVADGIKLYKNIFTNLNVDAFKSTYFTHQIATGNLGSGMRLKTFVENGFNFARPIASDNAMLHKPKKRAYQTSFIQCQYFSLESKYVELVHTRRPVSDLKTDTIKLKPLLLLLDSLTFFKMHDGDCYIHKTRLFDILQKVIDNQKLKSTPFIVPLIPLREDIRGNLRASNEYDYYTTCDWVFPIFKADVEYDMSVVENKIKRNKHKIN